MSELTEEQREMINKLAISMSRLCHQVICRRLEQFFEVIGEEIRKLPERSEAVDRTGDN